MTGYVRQSAGEIINGLDITAPPLNSEFNRLQDAFNGATGHTHDGSAGNAPPVNLSTSVTGILQAINGGSGGRNNVTPGAPTTANDNTQGYAPGSTWINSVNGRLYICVGNLTGAAVWREVALIQSGTSILPLTTGTVDLGSSTLRFKDAFLNTVNTSGNATIGGDLTVNGTSFQSPGGLAFVGPVATGSTLGSIIERGSNANGEYVRYADGTQQCWGSVLISLNTTSLQTFSYPIAFASGTIGLGFGLSSAPVTGTTSDFLDRSHQVSIHTSSTTQFAFLFRNGHYTTANITANAHWTAVGRWYNP